MEWRKYCYRVKLKNFEVTRTLYHHIQLPQMWLTAHNKILYTHSNQHLSSMCLLYQFISTTIVHFVILWPAPPRIWWDISGGDKQIWRWDWFILKTWNVLVWFSDCLHELHENPIILQIIFKWIHTFKRNSSNEAFF